MPMRLRGRPLVIGIEQHRGSAILSDHNTRVVDWQPSLLAVLWPYPVAHLFGLELCDHRTSGYVFGCKQAALPNAWRPPNADRRLVWPGSPRTAP